MMQNNAETIKTDVAISIPIHNAANPLAEKLGLSLSELCTLALTSYMVKYQENITEMLDRVYENESSAMDPALMDLQIKSLDADAW